MTVFASIFYDFNLPNATTWFYFSLLLAVALFFKFSRLLSVRNWDVLALFLLVPGLLLLQEAQGQALPGPANAAVSAASLVGGAGQAVALSAAGGSGLPALATAVVPASPLAP